MPHLPPSGPINAMPSALRRLLICLRHTRSRHRHGQVCFGPRARARICGAVSWCPSFVDVRTGRRCRRDFSRPVARQGLLVCDLVNRKPADWWSTVQSALYWGKPVLVIVNRAFLVSQRRYERLRRATVGLVVHDECHTGTGSTTRAFYEWLDIAHPQARIVGLSATPPALADAPHPALATIRSRYSLYDATADGTIVPLRMGWCDHQQRGRLSHGPARGSFERSPTGRAYKRSLCGAGPLTTLPRWPVSGARRCAPPTHRGCWPWTPRNLVRAGRTTRPFVRRRVGASCSAPPSIVKGRTYRALEWAYLSTVSRPGAPPSLCSAPAVSSVVHATARRNRTDCSSTCAPATG